MRVWSRIFSGVEDIGKYRSNSIGYKKSRMNGYFHINANDSINIEVKFWLGVKIQIRVWLRVLSGV